MVKDLPEFQRSEILNLWMEFEENKTFEAKFAQSCDKLETIDQHNLADIKTWVEEEYKYNLVHGGEEVKFSKALTAFKKLIDEQSRAKIKNR